MRSPTPNDQMGSPEVTLDEITQFTNPENPANFDQLESWLYNDGPNGPFDSAFEGWLLPPPPTPPALVSNVEPTVNSGECTYSDLNTVNQGAPLPPININVGPVAAAQLLTIDLGQLKVNITIQPISF